MKLFSKISLQLILLLLLSQSLFAQDIPAPMSPPRLVNDFGNVFSETERQALESKLLNYNDTTSTQIYVVIVNDLSGYAVSDFAFKIGEKWNIGQKGKDNGAVILIKPKAGNSKGEAYISVGYGLEAQINDAYAGRIVRNRMIPHFEQDDYFSGVNAAIDSMIKRLEGEFDPEMEEEGIPLSTIILFTIFFIIFITIISKKGDQNIDSDGSSRSGPVFFPPIVGGGRRGSFGSRGGFGGGGLGGFSGGGGGRFGGGGAGGSW